MSSSKSKTWVLAEGKDVGELTLNNFKLEEREIPKEDNLKNGEILIKLERTAIEPFIKETMKNTKGFAPVTKPGDPIQGFGIGQVIESKNSKYPKGNVVWGFFPWSTYAIIQEQSVWSDITNYPKEYRSDFLTNLGMPGMAGYIGLMKYGNPKPGETILISSASSTVASVVAQIAKLKGLNVVGLTSSDERIRELKNLGFDALVNYKKYDLNGLSRAIKDATPKGIDIYWDNVGGDVSDSVLPHFNDQGRFIICGAMSMYNDPSTNKGERIYLHALDKQLNLKGFVVLYETAHFSETLKQLVEWKKAGKIKSGRIQEINGFENAPQALLDLFHHKFFGKPVMIV